MNTGVILKLSDLVKADRATLLGQLTSAFAQTGFDSQRTSQTKAWEHQITCLVEVAHRLIQQDLAFGQWSLLLEFEIPRRQKRPDGILLDSDVIFVIEFKTGESKPGTSERWQTEEYALDLRDFHAGSSLRRIIPMLCLERHTNNEHYIVDDRNAIVWPVNVCSMNTLADRIIGLHGIAHDSGKDNIDPNLWIASQYRPTLTIIEAAEQLFSNHDVREISHSYAGNLTSTTAAIVQNIREAQATNERRICFVTGVPGAGKTLTGLNAVHDPLLRSEGRPPAVFLSGNGPLVKVIRTALVRSSRRQGVSSSEAKRRVSAFIQNVHAFLKYCSDNENIPPAENVVVFDEAQRAWNIEKMQREHDNARSEPTLVLDAMERCKEWCVLIALVGGGQEIHDGEGGLAEWGRALVGRQQKWTVVAPNEVLSGGASVAGHRLYEADNTGASKLVKDDRLHLSVSTRSWRAHKYNDWVNYLLSLQPVEAIKHIADPHEFPVVRTRDLEAARQWLRAHSRLEISRRCGLVASSGATRLRAYGIELSTAFRRGYPFDEWFLASPNDVRSSFRLEVAGTEFEVQGLELDWVCVCWGNDFYFNTEEQWDFKKFMGTTWRNVRDIKKRQFILNKYRVLLTRARQGIVIWVPQGLADDATLDPKPFDATYQYLAKCGVPELV